MHAITIVVSLISLAIWVYLVGFHGGFWRSGQVLDAGAPSGLAKVAVIVPARNEAEGIGRSLRSLRSQDYPGELAIILVDDNSTDGTADHHHRRATTAGLERKALGRSARTRTEESKRSRLRAPD